MLPTLKKLKGHIAFFIVHWLTLRSDSFACLFVVCCKQFGSKLFVQVINRRSIQIKIHISSGFTSLVFIMHCLILSVAWVQGAAFFLPQRSWKANKSQINFPNFSKRYSLRQLQSLGNCNVRVCKICILNEFSFWKNERPFPTIISNYSLTSPQYPVYGKYKHLITSIMEEFAPFISANQCLDRWNLQVLQWEGKLIQQIKFWTTSITAKLKIKEMAIKT